MLTMTTFSSRFKSPTRVKVSSGNTSITYFGITWVLQGTPVIGTFVLGDPWVVGPVTVLSVSPTWVDPYNGAMVNPTTTSVQGYDNQANPFSNTFGSRQTFPFSLTTGKSLISAKSKQPYKTGGAYQSLTNAAVLTCMASAPAAGSFRPPYAGVTKTLWNISDLNLSLVPSFPIPAGKTVPSFGSGTGLTFSQAMDYADTTDDPAAAGYYKTLSAMKYPFISHGTRVIASTHADLNSDPYYFNDVLSLIAYKCLVTHSERLEAIYRMVQIGIDSYAVSQFNGDGWVAIGGYGRWRKCCIVFAGILFNSVGMKAPAATTLSNVSGNVIKKFAEDGFTYYGANGTTALYGEDVPGAEGESEPPLNTNSGKRDPAGILDAFDVLLPNRGAYHKITSRTFPPQALLARSVTGMKTAWAHDPFFDYADRWVNNLSAYWTDTGIVGSIDKDDLYGYGGNGNGFGKAMFQTYRDTTSLPVLTSPVDTQTGATTGEASVSTNKSNGTLYWVVSLSATVPTKAQVKLGQTHAGVGATLSGSQTVSALGTQNIASGFTGLTTATVYYVHFMHEDLFANQSLVSSGDGFTPTSGGAWTTIFQVTLALNDNGWENGSLRNVVQITGGAGAAGKIRVTFEAPPTGTFKLDNVGIGISTMINANDTMNYGATTGIPVELKFGAASGFTLAASGIIVSDEADLTGFTSSKLLVAAMDVGSTGGYVRYLSGLGNPNSGINGTILGYAFSTNSYNSTSALAAAFNGQVLGIKKIEVR